MFNNHRMSCVTSLDPIYRDIQNIDYYTIAAITTSYYNQNMPNISYAGVLVPPTNMLMMWADGDYDIIKREYPSYLLTKDCDDMIVAFLAALTRKNIVLYIPDDEFDVYGPILLDHIYLTYGITCDTPFSQFSYNPYKIPLIISRFYVMDIMDVDTYWSMYPPNYQLPDFVINKLASDMHPFPEGASFDQYKDYFNKLNYSRMVNVSPINILRQ